MKKRPTPLILSLLACLGVFSLTSAIQAISPKPKDDPATDKAAADALPASQEATEESVLPDEPTLSTPTPVATPGPGELPVQPLPTEGIIPPSGPTVDEKRIATETFRKAKTEAEEQPEFLELRQRAFASHTEREKRALLREYYQTLAKHIIQANAAMKDAAEGWAYQQQNRLGRSRTEPDYVAPPVPAAVAALAAAKGSPAPGASTATPDAPVETPTPAGNLDFLPTLGN